MGREVIGRDTLPAHIAVYEGTLDDKIATGITKKALRIWRGQRKRCYTKSEQSYANYGAKGIEVYYGSRDFVSWYLHNSHGKKFTRPHCGRIDHSRGYSFDNIILQEQRDNNIERNKRCGQPNPPKKVTAYPYKKRPKLFTTLIEAAKYYGVHPETVRSHCLGKSKTSLRGVTFQWT